MSSEVETPAMTFHAYMLRCVDETFYTGQTDDLERRVGQHVAGEMQSYTQARRPLILVWSESFATREEAIAAEFRVKRWSQAKKQALIASDWQAVSRAAVPPRERVARRAGVSTSLDMNGEGKGAHNLEPTELRTVTHPAGEQAT